MTMCEVFAANLKREREKRGLTREQLAEKARVAPNTLFNYEKALHPLCIDIIESICAALEIRPAALFGEEGIRQ